MIQKVDSTIGVLMSQLQTNSLTERVNIIIISDHGNIFRYSLKNGLLSVKYGTNYWVVTKFVNQHFYQPFKNWATCIVKQIIESIIYFSNSWIIDRNVFN